jgi:hypothetical protein
MKQFNNLSIPSILLRFIACKEAPSARTQQEAEVVPAAFVVYGVDGHIIVEQAADKTDGRDKAVQKSVKKTVLLALEAFLHWLDVGAGGEAEHQYRQGSKYHDFGKRQIFHVGEFC